MRAGTEAIRLSLQPSAGTLPEPVGKITFLIVGTPTHAIFEVRNAKLTIRSERRVWQRFFGTSGLCILRKVGGQRMLSVSSWLSPMFSSMCWISMAPTFLGCKSRWHDPSSSPKSSRHRSLSNLVKRLFRGLTCRDHWPKPRRNSRYCGRLQVLDSQHSIGSTITAFR